MGWAKPVMVNTASYKHKKLDFCLVALAGPLMNFIIAFISLIGMYFTARYTGTGSVSGYFYYLFYYNHIVLIVQELILIRSFVIYALIVC
jgi:Zn-dependent protease